MTFTYLTESALITVDVFTDFVETFLLKNKSGDDDNNNDDNNINKNSNNKS